MFGLDPIVTLAFSMRSGSGVYVPVLGSGISQAAEIPTGWEILLDLTRRVATALGEDAGEDPARWYQQRFGSDANYSTLLAHLAATPAERNLVLRRYFEPTEEDKNAGRKTPTAAHKALAKLAAKGYVRIFVTTNFDRLLETALEAEGVQPQVISTTGHLAGALPFVHSRCTVVKVNGDYLDVRLRNTATELARYDRAMVRYLRRIFDEHGLIMCGWSGDWDAELRRAIEATASRRFTTYWCARGEPGTTAADLIKLRGFTSVSISSADQFFRDLLDKIEALEAVDQPHPLSARLASAAVKRLLPSRENEIRLADLVSTESAAIAEQLAAERERRREDGSVPSADVLPRANRYEAQTEVLAVMLATGCYWGEDWTTPIWKRAIDIVAEGAFDPSHTSRSINFIRYPVLFLIYAGGVAATAAKRFRNMYAILVEAQQRRENRRQPVTLGLEAYDIFNGDENLPKALRVNREYIPISNHLFERLRPILSDLHITNEEYEESFIRFEYLRSLVHMDRHQALFGSPSGEEGRFVGRGRALPKSIEATFDDEIERDGEFWPPLRAGFFDGSLSRLREMKTPHDIDIQRLRTSRY
jgi:hypothetical protein